MSNMSDFTIVDGRLTAYIGPGGDVVVPDGVSSIEGVSSIDRSVFSNANITSITLPSSLKEIGEVAFTDCKSITEIVIPENVDVIKDFAFAGCTNLKSVTLPESMTRIGQGAFYRCESLQEINVPFQIETIEEFAFSSCVSLKEVSIPKTVTAIKREAFKNCKGLERVLLADGLESIGSRAFEGCENLEELVLPDSVSVIEYDAFKECHRLKRINRPTNLCKIGEDAFYGCDSLGDSLADENGMLCIGPLLYQYFGDSPVVSVPEGIQTIGARAFAYNQTLKEIVLPKSIETIGIAAFLQCSNLETAEIPDGVKTIGANAFYKCERLREITIPQSVNSIGRDFLGFCRCEIFLHHWTPECTERLGARVEHVHVEDLSSVPSKYKLQVALNFIRENNDDLSTARAKSHLKYFSSNAGKMVDLVFEHRELLRFLCKNRLIKAKDIDLFKDEVQTWQDRLNDDEGIRLLEAYEKELGDNVDKARAKNGAVADKVSARLSKRDIADGLQGLTFCFVGRIPSYKKVWENRSEIDEYLNHYGAKTTKALNSQTDYVVILDKYEPSADSKTKQAEKLGIKVLTEEEFDHLVGKRFADVEQIIIPSWMDHIPSEAFNSMNGMASRKLQSIVLPDSIHSIGRGAFWHCEHLQEISIPAGVTEIEEFTFCGCKELEKVLLPSGIKSIGRRAFYGCKELSDITVPTGITIGEAAFGECESLADKEGFIVVNGTLVFCSSWSKTIAIPESVKYIGDGVFVEDSYPRRFIDPAEEITFPTGLVGIGRGSFSCCKHLTLVALPEGLERIGEMAFEACRELKRIWIPDSVTSIGKDAFSRCPKLRVLTPGGCYAEQYCNENGIKFTLCDQETAYRKMHPKT